jgi:hypothetical protein
MIRGLLIAALSLSAAVSRVSAVNVPYTHSLAKRSSRIQVPRTLLEKKESSPDLIARQATCGVGQAACSTGGCCDGSCCGDGCCPLAYVCNFVGNTPACCPVGQTCSNQISGCTDPTLVECGAGYDFCCPAGQACGRDANGNAECGGIVIGNGNGNANTNTAVVTPTFTTPHLTQLNTGLPGTTTNAGNGAFSIFNSFTSSLHNGGDPTTTPSSSNHLTGGGHVVVVGSGMLGMVALVAGAMIL